MDIFDIYITYVSWESGGKMRPVLVLEQNETIVNVFNITSQYNNKTSAIRRNYFKINEWQQAGLDKQSYIDTNMIRDIPVAALSGKPKIGRLSMRDIQAFIDFLNKMRD